MKTVMKIFKGTKGEWGVCSANKTEVNSFNGTAIAECGMSKIASLQEKEANAKLIAAAPEMLKTLIDVKEKLELLILPRDRKKTFYKRIESVIKKATE